MARIFSSGFELQSAVSDIEGGDVNNVATTINSTIFRSGITSLRVNPSNQEGAYDTTIKTSTVVYTRVYVYIATLPNKEAEFIQLYRSSNNTAISLSLLTDGTVRFTCTPSSSGNNSQIGSLSSALSTNHWYRFEVKVDVSANPWNVEAKIDGTVFASGTFANTAQNIDTVSIGPSGMTFPGNVFSGCNADIYYDDVAVNDNTGSFQNTYPGAGAIVHLQPNAAGDNNGFLVNVGGTVGATNNYTRVNEITPDDATTYNGDTVSGHIDDFTMVATPSSIGSSDTINVVQIGVRYRAVVASLESQFKVRVKKVTGGTVSSSAGIIPNSTTWKTNANATPRTYSLILYQDPDGGTWTKSTLDTSQIGYTISTTGTNATDISTVWMLIDSTQASIADDTITASDTTTVTDSVGILNTENINVNETSAITEFVDVLRNGNRDVTVSDASTVTENIQLEMDCFITISDSSTVTDSTQIMLESNISVSYTSTVTNPVKLLNEENIQVSESSTITENIVINEGIYVINVSEASAVTESPVVVISASNTFSVIVSDSSAVTESIALLEIGFVIVSESSTVSENISFLDTEIEGISDSTTVTDSEITLITSFVNVSDTSAVTDSKTVFIPILLVNLSDSTTVTDSLGFLDTEIEVIADVLTITESIKLLAENSIDVSEASTITDSIARTLVDLVNVSNGSTLTENIKLLNQESISKSEASTVTDLPTAVISSINTKIIVATEVTTITESISFIEDLLVSVHDVTVITDIAFGAPPNNIVRTSSFTITIPSTINFTLTKTG